MLKNVLALLACGLCATLSATTRQEMDVKKMLNELDREIALRDTYQQRKQEKIDSLRLRLDTCATAGGKYLACRDLSVEYSSFVYDSAFVYTRRMLELAEEIGNRRYENDARLQMAFVLISSGLYTEAKDMLSSVEIASCDSVQKFNYYTYVARMCFDSERYVKDEYFTPYYHEKGIVYQDSACRIQRDSVQKNIACGQLEMHRGNAAAAIGCFENALADTTLTYSDIALVTSCLGYLYQLDGNVAESKKMLIRAAIADVRNVTKETVALRNLAAQLTDLERADRYIKIADEDANFYNARQRMAEIGGVIATIQQEKIRLIEEQRNNYVRFFLVMCLLVIVGIVLLVIIIRQYRKLQAAKEAVLRNNENLQRTNDKLRETSKIKEEYIGYIFRMNADFIQRQSDMQRKISTMIDLKRYDDLKNVVSAEDLDHQRTALLENFDKIFLKLFPTFVDDYNGLFSPENRINLENPGLLNTDLRIFALIRLGVRENEAIAEFLNYSVNTIFAYKTRIKQKSLVSEDEFEEKIMRIKAV